MELYPHQRKAVDNLDNGKILTGRPGSGKSFTALAYYVEKILGGKLGDLSSVPPDMGVDLYIITTAKKRDTLDWDRDGARLSLIRECPALSLGGVRFVVDSWNNIDKYKDVKNAFFIFDEQRVVGAGAWSKSFVHIARQNRWILLSATPGDTWLDYIPVFLANNFYKNRTEFKREHVVYNTFTKYPKVDHYVGLGRLVRQRNAVLVEMPYEQHTVRETTYVDCAYDKDLYERVVKHRWHVYEGRPLRDAAELFSVMRKVVNSDASRMRALTKLLEKHPKVIVFYNFDYELEILRTLSELAEESGTERSTSISSSISPRPSTSSSERRALSTASNQSERSPVSDFTASPSSPNLPTLPGRSRRSNHSSLPISKPTTKSTSASSDISLDTSSKKTLGSSSERSTEIAEWNGHKHQEIPKTDRWVYLVQYVAGSEGWNCIETDAMVFWSLTYSYKNFHQAHGRIDRLNTPFTNLHYYILWAGSPIERMIRKALGMKKNFNEAKYAPSW